MSLSEKVHNLRQALEEENASMMVITALDEVACEFICISIVLRFFGTLLPILVFDILIDNLVLILSSI